MVKNEYKKMEVRKVMDTESDTSHIVNREFNQMHSAEEQLFKTTLVWGIESLKSRLKYSVYNEISRGL